MKTIKIISSCLLLLIINSCQPPRDFPPLNSYTVKLYIQDVNNNDILKDIPFDIIDDYEENSVGRVTNEYLKYNYTLPEFDYSEGAIYRDPFDAIRIFKDKTKENNHLILKISILPGHPIVETIVYKMTSEYIFGDNTEHTINTYWKSNAPDYNFHQCVRVTLDGLDIPLTISEGNPEYNDSSALLVLE